MLMWLYFLSFREVTRVFESLSKQRKWITPAFLRNHKPWLTPMANLTVTA